MVSTQFLAEVSHSAASVSMELCSVEDRSEF